MTRVAAVSARGRAECRILRVVLTKRYGRLRVIEALGIAMVKNEADVIEAFVRHNLGFMDALAIVDNDSIDGTREILVQLQQEGLPIILFDDPVVAHFHAEKSDGVSQGGAEVQAALCVLVRCR